VHCLAGVSRSYRCWRRLSGLHATPEWPASAALARSPRSVPRAWPNLLILEFGDALLGPQRQNRRRSRKRSTARPLGGDPEFGYQMSDSGPRPREPSDPVPSVPFGSVPRLTIAGMAAV